VAALPNGKHLNPQWSPDGRSLYFLSDRDGIANVYRVSVGTSEVTQITAVATGVSGITNASPALSIASRSGLAAFSVYENGKYDIYTLDPSPLAYTLRTPTVDAAVLPPATRDASEVAALLADATFGLPEGGYDSVPYKPRLTLEAAGQPMMGVGISRFGPAVSGGLSLYFGDMLENHLLATTIGVNSGWGGDLSGKDILAAAAYLTQERRWNWGGIAAQIPYLSSGFQTSIGYAANGDLIESDRLITYRQTEQSLSAVASYPFDRARRLEFHGGATHLTFDRIVNTLTYSLLTGRLYEDTTETASLAGALTLGTSSAAYVFDTTSFGATGPIQGQRYRLEADPTFGTVNFTGLLADYRRYFMPVPFYTLGVRTLHYGRYGNIGNPGLVRGYDAYSIESSECIPTLSSDCPVIDRLLGSRLLVANLEFRFPLLRPFGISRSMYGPLPVDVALSSLDT
jgi:hypothetical protein